MLIFTFLILLVLLFIICAAVLGFQAKEVRFRQEVLEEALWGRRHRIPLLLEILKKAGQPFSFKDELIDLRAKLMNKAYTLPEQIEMEKELTDMLNKIFRTASENSAVKTEPLYFALQKEFTDELLKIRIALNDYNFSFLKWKRLIRNPFFKIFEFAFEIGKNSSLSQI